jgi:hypothetical protein
MTIHSPRQRGFDGQGSDNPAMGTPAPDDLVSDKIVRHGGRSFVATTTMAAIFVARAEDVIARGDTELVPLLHRDGVELLLISPESVFSVGNVAVGIRRRKRRS